MYVFLSNLIRSTATPWTVFVDFSAAQLVLSPGLLFFTMFSLAWQTDRPRSEIVCHFSLTNFCSGTGALNKHPYHNVNISTGPQLKI